MIEKEKKTHVLSKIRLTQTCGLAQEHPKWPQPVQARIKDKSLSRICDKAACIIRAISCPFIEGRMGALPTFGLAGSFRQAKCCCWFQTCFPPANISYSAMEMRSIKKKPKLTIGNESQTWFAVPSLMVSATSSWLSDWHDVFSSSYMLCQSMPYAVLQSESSRIMKSYDINPYPATSSHPRSHPRSGIVRWLGHLEGHPTGPGGWAAAPAAPRASTGHSRRPSALSPAAGLARYARQRRCKPWRNGWDPLGHWSLAISGS